MVNCKNCGIELSEDAVYCSKCGTKQDIHSEVQPVAVENNNDEIKKEAEHLIKILEPLSNKPRKKINKKKLSIGILFIAVIIVSVLIFKSHREISDILGSEYLGKQDGKIISLSISKDNKKIASVSSDNTTKVWDIETRKETKEIFTFDNPLMGSLTYDGKYVATLGEQATLIFWDTEDGKNEEKIFYLSDLNDSINVFALTEDGKFFATGDSKGKINVWNISLNKIVKTFQDKVVWTLAFSPDGKRLVSGSSDRSITLWDLEKNKKINSVESLNEFNVVKYSPDGELIASGGIPGGNFGNNIQIWDGKNLNFEKDIKSITATSLSFSSDGGFLAIGSRGPLFDVLDVNKGESQYGAYIIPTLDGPTTVSFSPDDKYLIVGLSSGDIITLEVIYSESIWYELKKILFKI